MSAAKFRVRRATLDDLGQLVALWQMMSFPADDLAKRITEFQVAEGPEGKLVGAIALQIADRHGRICDEGFADFALADQLRPVLWERLQSVASNHGLLRIWTQEQAPFWSRCGLASADQEALSKLPALWRPLPSTWLTLKLKDEIEQVMSADKEFALFMESEKQRTQKALQQARVLKVIATLLALAVLLLVLVGAFIIFRNNPQFFHR